MQTPIQFLATDTIPLKSNAECLTSWLVLHQVPATTTANDAGNTGSTWPQLLPEIVANSSASALPPVVQYRVHDEGIIRNLQ